MNGRFLLLVFATVLAGAATTRLALADEREFRSLTGFDAIEAGGGIDLNLRQGDEFVVEVITDDGELGSLVTEVDGKTLKIRHAARFSLFDWGGGSYEVNITLPMLTALEVSGSSDVNGDGTFAGDSLSIRASGGSDLSLDVAVDRLDVRASGGSDVRISGQTGTILINNSGGSDFDAGDLEAREADVQSSGGSDVTLTVRERIAVNASGGSDVDYGGAPRIVTVNASGGSDVRSR